MQLTSDSIPQLALEFMNRDHAEFVVLRDRLLGLLTAKAPDEQLGSALHDLVEHTRQHFAAEESVMQEARFPAYTVHKGEHDTVLADMSAQVARWHQGRDNEALRNWVDQAVGDWFLSHIGSMDFVTAQFIDMQRKER